MAADLLLDLDGTIADPREGVVHSIAHALATLERPIPSDEALSCYIGPPLARTFATLLDTTDEALVASAIEAYRERFRKVGSFENRLYPEVPPALAALKDGGRRLYLVTVKPHVFARRILDHFELSPLFDGVYGPELEDLHCTKQMLIGRALEKERLSPSAAVMIGDRGEDMTGARAFRVRSIGVAWGYGSRQELEEAGADEIVGSVPELLASLRAH